MEFEITREDMEPGERRYYKVMGPLWDRLGERLGELTDVDWRMRETRGPLELIAEGTVDAEGIDWIEIRGECAERVEEAGDDGRMVVRLTDWFGMVVVTDEFAAQRSIEGGIVRTERQERVEGAVHALREVCDELGVAV